MKYTVEHNSDIDYCVVSVSGELRRPEDSITLQNLAYDIRAKSGINKFLFNMSQAIIKGKIVDSFQVGALLAEKKLDKNFSIALVYSGDMDQHRFMENVLINRGYNVRVFDNIIEATEWLKQTELTLDF